MRVRVTVLVPQLGRVVVWAMAVAMGVTKNIASLGAVCNNTRTR